ncbi:MAG: hypothetical protein M1837_000636 [Sclerophora amabilis]|nr:MAG: hypothetical protein M1837_000636 [Sclerophora amabilis]
MACSYLISECDWSISESLARFTERRMRAGFGQGVSIPSQLRWIEYVDRWAKHGKIYVERQVEILEVHVWGLRDGVKVAVEGYVNEGRHIKTFHIFKRDERMVLDDPNSSNQEIVNAAHFFNEKRKKPLKPVPSKTDPNITNSVSFASSTSQVNDPLPTRAATTAAYLEARLSPAISRVKDLNEEHTGSELGGGAVIFRPSEPLILPTSDINIDFERRNRAAYGWTMVTAVAHVWFNAFFEGQGPETSGKAADSGIFEIEWDKMDGVKGSARKGTRAFDRFAVVWKATGDDFEEGKERGITTRRRESIIREPKLGEEVEQLPAADWKGANAEQPDAMDRDLGLRVASPASADISKASSVRSAGSASTKLREQPSGSETPLPSGSKSETDEEENVKEDDVPAQDQLPRLQPNLTHPGPEQAKSGLDTADETTPIVDSVASTDMRGTQHGKGSTDPGNGQETLGRILEGVKSASTGDLPEEPKR